MLASTYKVQSVALHKPGTMTNVVTLAVRREGGRRISKMHGLSLLYRLGDCFNNAIQDNSFCLKCKGIK